MFSEIVSTLRMHEATRWTVATTWTPEVFPIQRSYLALYFESTLPRPDKTGWKADLRAPGFEVYAPTYSRQELRLRQASDGYLENAEMIDFGTATCDWGLVVEAGIFDQNEQLLIRARLSTPRSVHAGDCLRFLPGSIKVKF